MTKVSAIVLAAGRSRRMGAQNKMLMTINGRPMIEQVAQQVAETTCHELLVVAGREISDHLCRKYRVILNERPEDGLTSSIQAGIRACATDTDGYMICLGDQPFTTSLDYGAIMTEFSAMYTKDLATIAIPYFKGKRGNPTIFSRSYREDLLRHSDPEGCKGVIMKNREHWCQVNLDTEAVLLDIDTQEDYLRLT